MALLRLSFLICSLVAGLACAAHADRLAIGDDFPRVTLPNWTDASVEIDGGAREVVVVEFWASWCTPCRSILPEIATLASEHAKGMHVYAVNIDRDRTKADDFLRQHLPIVPESMTLLHDPGGELLSRFGARGMPAVYAVQGGIVRLVEAGAQAGLLERLRELVGEAPARR